MRIYLRPITEEDGTYIVKWRNSDKVRKHCMTKAPITMEANQKFFRENVNDLSAHAVVLAKFQICNIGFAGNNLQLRKFCLKLQKLFSDN